MSKQSFVNPFVLLLHDEGDVVVIGGGTGQGTTEPQMPVGPCNFAFWVEHFASEDWDLLGDGYDMYDYADWWRNQDFTLDDWLGVGNSQEDWDEYIGG